MYFFAFKEVNWLVIFYINKLFRYLCNFFIMDMCSFLLLYSRKPKDLIVSCYLCKTALYHIRILWLIWVHAVSLVGTVDWRLCCISWQTHWRQKGMQLALQRSPDLFLSRPVPFLMLKLARLVTCSFYSAHFTESARA